MVWQPISDDGLRSLPRWGEMGGGFWVVTVVGQLVVVHLAINVRSTCPIRLLRPVLWHRGSVRGSLFALTLIDSSSTTNYKRTTHYFMACYLCS